MDSYQLQTIQARVQLSLDWAITIEQSYRHASRDLQLLHFDHSEIFAGIRQQVALLTDLQNNIHSATTVSNSPRSSDGVHGVISDQSLFAALCDAYSFYPSNKQLLSLFRYIWSVLSRDSFLRLINDLSSQILFVHISCHKRIDKARASVRSFGTPAPDESHLIVVGNPNYAEPGFSFHYHDGVLEIPVDDSYECLYQKTLYSFSLLRALLGFERLFKLDDDVLLHNRDTLTAAIKMHHTAEIDYSGTHAGSDVRLGEYRGWHLNKCYNKSFESCGVAPFCSTDFAMGGLGYQLSHRAARALCDYFLSNPMFYKKPHYPLLEDATIGLILRSENIHCVNVECIDFGFGLDHNATHMPISDSQEHATLSQRLSLLLPRPSL